jgi:hypothetical protein
MHASLRCAIFATLLLPAACILSKGLQQLTADTFHTTVTGSPPSFVAFVRPSQPHYADIHPLFVELGDKVRNMRIIEVDCDSHGGLCEPFRIRRFPYLAFYTEDTNTSGVESARPYQGKRTRAGLEEFVKKVTTPAIHELESAPSPEVVVSEIGGEAVFLMLQPALPPLPPNTSRAEGPKDPLIEAYRVTANRLRDHVGFANLRGNSLPDIPGLAALLPGGGNVSTPVVVRLGLEGGGLVPLLGGSAAARELPYAARAMAALRDAAARGDGDGGGGGPLPAADTDAVQAGLLAWVHRWRLPLVSAVTGRSLPALLANPEGRHVAVAVLEDEEAPDTVAAAVGADGEAAAGRGGGGGAGARNAAARAVLRHLAHPHESPLAEAVRESLLFATLSREKAGELLREWGAPMGGAAAVVVLRSGGGESARKWAAPGVTAHETEPLSDW